MSKNWIAVVAAIGGLLLLIPSDMGSPLDLIKPRTEFQKQVDAAMPIGSTHDMQIMARSIRALSNVVATNPEVRVERRIDEDPGKWLKDTLDLSYARGYDFEKKYPELHSVVADWFDQNIQDGITSQELVQRWRELAKALE